MNTKSALALLALTAAGAFTPVAAQQQSNLYAVVGIGRSTIDVDPSSVDAFALLHGLTTSNTTVDSKDIGWKLQLGYQVGPTFAWEFGYMSLGTSRFVNTNNVYTSSGDRKADLFNIDLVGKWPLSGQFSLLARVGGYRWETDSNLPTSTGMTKRNDDGFDVKFGAGLQYDFTKNFALRGSFDRFNGVGSTTTAGDSKFNLFSVDAVLKF